MYVLGGDDYVSDTTYDGRSNTYAQDFLGRPRSPNKDEATSKYYPNTGGGNLLNDVWWSSGAQWDVFADYRAGNGFGEPLPRLTSRTEWESAPAWPGIPTEEVDGWREYLGCCHASRTYICFSPDLLCGNGDPYLPERRWSPRRGHRAVTVNLGATPYVVVMGGRAQSLERMTGTELTGGFLGDIFDPSIAGRERSILTSDIWFSRDGVTWDFTNGGCYVNQLEHATAPGSIIAECETDKNCTDAGLGNAECVDAGTPLHPNRRMCVCRHWSPRERFAASVLNGVIYVSGGIMYQQREMCGRFACGSETATFLDDVWISEDVGRSWTQITSKALLENRWGRADHAMAFLTDRWWWFGGRSQEEEDGSESIDKLFNDAYQSPAAGNEFVLNSTTSPWLPRSAFRVVPHPSARAMYLIGGEIIQPVDAFTVAPPTAVEKVEQAAARAPTNVNRILNRAEQQIRLPGFVVNNIRVTTTDDTWVYYQDDQAALGSQDYGPLGGRRWYQDFSPESATSHEYVWVDMPLAHIYFNHSETLLAKLYALKGSDGKQALTTIYDLATINREAVLAFLTPEGPQRDSGLPPFLPEICSLRETARALMDRCVPRGRGYDDQFYRDGPYAAIPKILSVVDEVVVESGCEGQPAAVDWDAVDVVCRQRFSPRRSFGAGLMGGKVYVVGGYEAPDFYSNEAWYRDEFPPQAGMGSTPSDMTSESVFKFDCSETGCVFEIRAWDQNTGRLLRNWTKVTSVYDAIRLNSERRPTRVELRATDPAGNRDSTLRYSSSDLGPRNVHVWTYIPPFPLLELILGIVFGLLFIFACIFFYRRWQQKKAMERYMAKRLARKLKQQQEDSKEEKKKKTKKKKKKEARESVVEDEDAKNRFKALLEKRAQERMEEEYNALRRRKTAKETFKHDQLMASKQQDAAKPAMSALESYKEEIKKGRGNFDRTEYEVGTRNRILQSADDDDDVRVRAVNGPGVPATRGRRSVAGAIDEPGEYVNRALSSSIARKALSSSQGAKGRAGPQSDTDVSLPGQVEKKERTGPVPLAKSQGPAPPVWRPGGAVRRVSNAAEHDMPVDWVNKSTRRMSAGGSASPAPGVNRGARAGAGGRPAGAAAGRSRGSDGEGELPGQV